MPETFDEAEGERKDQRLLDQTSSRFLLITKGITHKPTEASFIPDPDEPGWGQLDPGKLGNVLPNGHSYEPNEVDAMM